MVPNLKTDREKVVHQNADVAGGAEKIYHPGIQSYLTNIKVTPVYSTRLYKLNKSGNGTKISDKK